MFDTPILFLIFNRPDTTALVFEQIKKVQPKYLYVAADGPRSNSQGEDDLCKASRDIVLEGIDWDCEVRRLFRDENLGCGKAVSEAITWFFEHVEEGIILEDDTVPDISFFTYCKVLLERYRYVEKVMHIGGNNFQFGLKRGGGDYYFSTLSHIWGWATWKTRWHKYEFDLTKASRIAESSFRDSFNNNKQFIDYYKSIFTEVADRKIDTWDYQWLYAVVANNGFAICPNVNLVRNIGFGNGATHTKNEPDWNILNVTETITSFCSPRTFEIDYDADEYTLENIIGVKPIKPLIPSQKSFSSRTKRLKGRVCRRIRNLWRTKN